MNIKEIENLVELPLKLVLNDKVMCDMLCTPQDVENLFRGWLFSQGYIEKSQDIKSIDFNVSALTVNVVADIKEPEKTPLLSDLAAIALKNTENFKANQIDDTHLYNCYLARVNRLGEILCLRKNKGLHAAIINHGGEIIFKEDVSRHCAIDKAVGECIIRGIDLTQSILVTTGRISTEFLFKAKMLNMPIIASLKYPSITGEIIAKDWEINLATFINSDKAELKFNSVKKLSQIV